MWSTIPDEELLATADKGKLSDPRAWSEQVKRMLADPRARDPDHQFSRSNG